MIAPATKIALSIHIMDKAIINTIYFSTLLGILKNNITAPISKTLKPIIPAGIGPNKLLFVDNDIQLPTSPIISEAP